mmetsp:Transcript_15168/g.23762  ORF Transcript_15168/g.23762 Transcript_15168/m.23762 type:complete len:307 (-) Transcript_15168:1140-2060(-)
MNPLHCLTEVIDVEIKAQAEASSCDESENSCDERASPPARTSAFSKQASDRSLVESSLDASHVIKHLFHSDLSVVTFNHIEYLIGVQVARRLKRKTFNMYRCMKKKKIELRRATQEEVDYLTLVGAVHAGTHSITLVPFVECLCFVADALFRHIRFPNEDVTAKRRKSFVSMHPRIHRRKPLPWDIQKAVKKQTVATQEASSVSPSSPSSPLALPSSSPSSPHYPTSPASFPALSALSGNQQFYVAPPSQSFVAPQHDFSVYHGDATSLSAALGVPPRFVNTTTFIPACRMSHDNRFPSYLLGYSA